MRLVGWVGYGFRVDRVIPGNEAFLVGRRRTGGSLLPQSLQKKEVGA